MTAKANFQIFRALIIFWQVNSFCKKWFVDFAWIYGYIVVISGCCVFLARKSCSLLFSIMYPWNWSKSNKNLIKASFLQTRNSENLKTVSILIGTQIKESIINSARIKELLRQRDLKSKRNLWSKVAMKYFVNSQWHFLTFMNLRSKKASNLGICH